METRRTNRIGWLACAACIATLTFGCPPGGGSGPERTAVDHESVQQGVGQHSEAAVEAVVDGLILLESSDAFDEYGGSPPQEEEEGCVVAPDDGDDGTVDEPQEDTYECTTSSGGAEDFEDQAEELTEFLETRIFTEANVEAEQGDAVVYLLDGEIVCDEEDFFDEQGYQQCVEDVDALEIRLKAFQYETGPFQIDVLLGPERIHPATLAFSASEISSELYFDNFEAAVDHVAGATGEQVAELPDTFSGIVKVGYYDEGSVKRFAVDILSDLEIEGEAFELYAAGVGEVFGLGIDTAEEAFEASIGLGEFSATGEVGTGYDTTTEPEPIDVDGSEDGEEDYDEPYEEPEPSDPVDIGVELAGLTSTVNFVAGTEEIAWTDVGLGGGPARLLIDGETVIDVELDAGIGGMFDALLQMKDDGLKYSVEPGVELEIGLMFQKVVDEFDDAEDWMLDDVLTIALDGHANPAVLFGDAGLEVLRGHLSLDSQTTGAGADVTAGQCLVDSDDEFDDEFSEDATLHPFDEVEAGTCDDSGSLEDTDGL